LTLPSPVRHGRAAVRLRFASVLVLLPCLHACGGPSAEDEAERAMRARQMRDVSRMLDALEMPAGDTAQPPPAASEAPLAFDGDAAKASSPREMTSRWMLPLALVGAGALVAATCWRWWLVRRRRRRTPLQEALSIAGFFEPRPIPRPDVAASPISPTSAHTWVYQSSPYETPLVMRADEPLDLLLPEVDSQTPPPDRPTPMVALPALRDRLHALDEHHAMHLVGDPRFPALRRVGEATTAYTRWRDVLHASIDDEDDDGHLARWLLPALLVLRSGDMPRRDAEPLIDEAAAHARRGLTQATAGDRGYWIACLVRVELARVIRLSGATRLFALRDLHARRQGDLDAHHGAALDAWIDVQLAWGACSLGGGAITRLVEAESLCDRLAACGDDWVTRSLCRRGEVATRRGDDQRAIALFEDAYARSGDAGTALMLACCAQRRATRLPPAEAAEACSLALTHAFVAEQDPAWRIDALACRLAAQLVYEALPGRAVQGDIVASLERDLIALHADPATARSAIATARRRAGHLPTQRKGHP